MYLDRTLAGRESLAGKDVSRRTCRERLAGKLRTRIACRESLAGKDVSSRTGRKSLAGKALAALALAQWFAGKAPSNAGRVERLLARTANGESADALSSRAIAEDVAKRR